MVLGTDQYGSFRTSLALNRSLIKDKLSVYGAFLYNDQQFQRKPSGDLTRRQYGAITYKPFSKTVIRGFAENFQNNANRPNSMTPRDFVTPWLLAGRPSYDPTTRMITVLDTNRVYGPCVANVNSPGYNAAVNTILGAGAPSTVANNPLFVPGIQFEDTSRPLRLIDGGQSIAHFQRNPVLYAPAQTNRATATPTPATLGGVQKRTALPDVRSAVVFVDQLPGGGHGDQRSHLHLRQLPVPRGDQQVDL